MNQTYKKHLARKVRQRFNLPTNSKIHFTAQEMMTIVSTIKNVPLDEVEWTSIQYFFEEELFSLGWIPQDTVDTHPTIQNLEFLKSVKFLNNSTESELQSEPPSPQATPPPVNESKEGFTFTTLLEIISNYNLDPKEISIEKDKFVVRF